MDDQRHTDVYNRKMDVINRGFSGYNTDWILPVFEQVQMLRTTLPDAPD